MGPRFFLHLQSLPSQDTDILILSVFRVRDSFSLFYLEKEKYRYERYIPSFHMCKHVLSLCTCT